MSNFEQFCSAWLSLRSAFSPSSSVRVLPHSRPRQENPSSQRASPSQRQQAVPENIWALLAGVTWDLALSFKLPLNNLAISRISNLFKSEHLQCHTDRQQRARDSRERVWQLGQSVSLVF